MLSINLKRPFVSLTVMAGLLTVTMLDCELNPVIIYNGHAGLGAN